MALSLCTYKSYCNVTLYNYNEEYHAWGLLRKQHIILITQRHECYSHTTFTREMKIYSYTPIPIPANRIWPCCLRPNATYFLVHIYVFIVYTFQPTRSSQGHRTTRILYTRLHSELLAYFVRGCTQNCSDTLYETAIISTHLLGSVLYPDLLTLVRSRTTHTLLFHRDIKITIQKRLCATNTVQPKPLTVWVHIVSVPQISVCYRS